MKRAHAMAAAMRLGGREMQEDAVAIDAAHGIAIVADGHGGVCTGVVAGQLACAGLAHQLREGTTADDHGGAAAIEETLRRAFAAVNALVFAAARDERIPAGPLGDAVERALDDEARWIVDAARDGRRMSLRGMGAAAVACLLRGGVAVIGHAGDVRAYLLRGGELRALTRDHDLAFEFPELEGTLSPDLARVITRGLGVSETLDPSTRVVELAAGDTLLLCTDGLHDVVADVPIAELLRGGGSPQERCDALVARALADGGKCPDNVAVAIIDVA